jgi:hypothetical protein
VVHKLVAAVKQSIAAPTQKRVAPVKHVAPVPVKVAAPAARPPINYVSPASVRHVAPAPVKVAAPAARAPAPAPVVHRHKFRFG